MRRPYALLSLAALATLAPHDRARATAANADGGREAPRVEAGPSPKIAPIAEVLFAHRSRTGETLPVFRRSETFERTGTLPVVIRSVRALDAAHGEALRRAGVVFGREGRAIASGAYLARVDEAALRALARDPEILSVSVDLQRDAPRPLELAAQETRTLTARRAVMAKSGALLDGAGTVIADIDSPIYHFHPAFFRADGGAYRWVDVNGDGELTPDVDGVDLDNDGKISPAEVLHRLEAVGTSRYTNETIVKNASFTIDLEYLYTDTNGNGRRDHGAGFDDSTPAFGEPLFVVDDANGDGRLATTEKLLRLNTSKIRALRSQDRDHTRGAGGRDGLTGYDPEASPDLAAAMGHATGVASILAGGVPGVSRWPGLAPGAELLVHDSTSEDGTVAAVQWALDKGANVVLTEFAPYTSVTIDGSSEDERILDAAVDQGVIAVSPAGNLAGGKKHRTLTLQAGATVVPMQTTPGFSGSRLIQISLHHKGPARALGLKLTVPGRGVIDLPESAPQGAPFGNITAYTSRQTTSRGTHERFIYLLDRQGMPEGDYPLEITLDAGASVEVEAFVADERTSWAYGFTFDQDSPTRTVCNPATSDKTLGVAAYVLHDEPAYYGTGPRGTLATYSSRGPRIDGAGAIDIAAPDNPMAAQPPLDRSNAVAFGPFGGTSGAGPHVAAAVALLRQAYPAEPPSRVRERLLEGARPESRPDAKTTFGSGKLDVAKAAGLEIADGAAPTVRLVAPARGNVDAEATLRVEAESTGETFVRWDLDYDGKPDTEWLPVVGGRAERALTPTATGRLDVRVELRDATGQLAASTAAIEVDEAIEGAAPTTTTRVEESGCGCRVTGRASDGPAAALGGVAAALALLTARLRRRDQRARVNDA
jgi:subtilisin family serine protease